MMQIKTTLGIVALLFSNIANATILTFDFGGTDYSVIPQTYGDRVTSTVMGTHSYGGGGGFTPNVELAYQGDGVSSLSLWTTGFNSLTNVINNELDGDNGLTITFTADAGYHVALTSLDMGNYQSPILSIPEFTITNGSGATLFSQSDIQLPGTASSHTTFDFGGSSLIANELILHIDTTGLGGSSDNVGLDNILFSQMAAVPVPAAVWLFGSGLLGLIGFSKRKKSA